MSKKCHRCHAVAVHGHNECRRHLKMKADAAREVYQTRKKRGLCVRCPGDNIQPALPGYVTCGDHTVENRKHAKANMREIRRRKK